MCSNISLLGRARTVGLEEEENQQTLLHFILIQHANATTAKTDFCADGATWWTQFDAIAEESKPDF